MGGILGDMRDEVFSLIKQEEKRQAETLALIPSENIASDEVREVVGSCLMNKYAEGQVGARYYQGNEVVDEIEALCKQRALELFGLDESEWGVNVQVLSGSPANLAIYNALLEPGKKIMSMFLPDGGHLSHGWRVGERPVSMVSKFWEVVFYKTDEKTRKFDYGAIREQAKKEKPALIVSGGTAYPREIDHKAMGEIAGEVGAYYLADVSHEAGLIAGGVNKNPFEWADVVMMTTHKTLRGPRGAMIFAKRKSSNKIQDTSNKIENLSREIDRSVFPGIQGGPHMHTIGAMAVALGEARTEKFRVYAKQVVANAKVLAESLVEKGFEVVSGGTDKHLLLVDLSDKDVDAWVVAWALEAAGIVVNRNSVPGEKGSSIYPSGIRMGTPAVTSRGMGESEMKRIGEWFEQVVGMMEGKLLAEDKEKRGIQVKTWPAELKADKRLIQIREKVVEMCREFPVR